MGELHRLQKMTQILLKKTLTGLLVGVFLFNSAFGWAQEEKLFSTRMENMSFSSGPAKSNLAPESRMSRSEFKEKYKIGQTLLAHKALNEVIGKYICNYFNVSFGAKVDISKLPMYRTETVNVEFANEVRKLEIPIVGIPDVLKNTGQSGHVGLGWWNNIPVIYVDKKYFYTENDVIRHDKEEIAKWEKKRLEMEDELDRPISYQEIRSVINETGKAKEWRDIFHGSSIGLDILYAQALAEDPGAIDLDKIYDLYYEYGLDREDIDFNIAAGSTPARSWSALCKKYPRLSLDNEDSDFRNRFSRAIRQTKRYKAIGISELDTFLAAVKEAESMVNRIFGTDLYVEVILCDEDNLSMAASASHGDESPYITLNLNHPSLPGYIKQASDIMALHELLHRMLYRRITMKEGKAVDDSGVVATLQRGVYLPGFGQIVFNQKPWQEDAVGRRKEALVDLSLALQELVTDRLSDILLKRSAKFKRPYIKKMRGRQPQTRGPLQMLARCVVFDEITSENSRETLKDKRAFIHKHLSGKLISSIEKDFREFYRSINQNIQPSAKPKPAKKGRQSHITRDVMETYARGPGDISALEKHPGMKEAIRSIFTKGRSKKTKGIRILDLATGTGLVPKVLAQTIGEDVRVVGIDISPKMLHEARTNLDGLRNVELIQGNIFNAPALVRGERFDIMIIANTLVFYPYEDRIKILSQARQVLRKGGQVVILYIECDEGHLEKSTKMEPGDYVTMLKEDIGFAKAGCYVACEAEKESESGVIVVWGKDIKEDWKPSEMRVAAVRRDRIVEIITTIDRLNREIEDMPLETDAWPRERQLNANREDLWKLLCDYIWQLTGKRFHGEVQSGLPQERSRDLLLKAAREVGKAWAERLHSLKAAKTVAVKALKHQTDLKRATEIYVELKSPFESKGEGGGLSDAQLRATRELLILRERLGTIFPGLDIDEDSVNGLLVMAEGLDPHAPAGGRKGSPVKLLETLKNPENNYILQKALNKNEGISVGELVNLRSPYARRTVEREFEILKDLEIFVPVVINGKTKRGYYRFSDMMIGANEDYTKTLINVIKDVKFQVGRRGNIRPLHRGDIPKEERPLVKEILRLHITNYIHTHMKEVKITDKPYIVKAWKGYGAPSQQSLLTKIRTLTEDTPFQVSFEKIEDLVGFACKRDNVNDRTVTILPLNMLDEAQIARLKDEKARVMYINLDREILSANDLTPLEALIGVGRAYLVNDDSAFYKLYELLTQSTDYTRISLAKLKEDPELFINALNFILTPITTHDPVRVNERMRELLISA